MTWNYRIVKKEYPDEIVYQIHEAYYDKGKKKPRSITKNPVSPFGETIEELAEDLEYFSEAFKHKILNYPEDFPWLMK